MIQFKTEKGEFVLVDVSTIGAIPYVKLLVNNKLICEISEATEEDARNLLKFIGAPWYGYKDYTNTHNWFHTALDSLHSLLTSKGIDINNGNWYLFKKV